MPVNLNSRTRVWREPEDNDFLRNRHGVHRQEQIEPVAAARPTATLPPPAPSPPSAPPPPFWAAGTPVPPNALSVLPQPPLQGQAQANAEAAAATATAPAASVPVSEAAPTTSEVVEGRMRIPAQRRSYRDDDGEFLPQRPGVAPSPTPVAAAAAVVVAAPPAPRPYVGERPVDSTWLAQRESALKSIRADYEAARAQALAQPGSSVGWIEARISYHPGRDSQPQAIDGVLVELHDPNAEPVPIGYDEGGASYARAAGRWVTFDEAAFAQHYRTTQAGALSGTAALAASYATDAASVFNQHPELWALATSDHALNAGPPPPGRAMGDAAQLATLDLYMADPQVAALIRAYGGSVSAPSSAMAQDQVRLHGQARYEQMGRLSNAMASVRQQYFSAMEQARSQGGAFWEERPASTTADGELLRAAERVFNVDAFTDWYIQQGGLQHRAFADFYGRSHTTPSAADGDGNFHYETRFDNPNWALSSASNGMYLPELVRFDPNDPPRMHDGNAAGFDLEAGWVTHVSNIKEKRDWAGTVFQIGVVAVVSWVSWGAGTAWASSTLGLVTGTTANVMVAGAIAGGAAAAASGTINGNLSFKGVLQGALAGAISGGLLKGAVGQAVAQYAGPAGTVALRTTVQGGIQALLGGSFKDGAIAGFASGLADVVSAQMNSSIGALSKADPLNAGQDFALRGMAKVVTSAIRALGNPSDPSYAFASALVGELMASNAPTPVPGGGATVIGPAFDDDGNLMPGVVDAQQPPAQQAMQLAQHLQAQGLPAEQATAQALQTIARQVAAAPVAGAPGADDGIGNGVQRIEINGRALPRDALGNRYENDAQGNQVVHLIAGGMLALNARQALPIGPSGVTLNATALARLARVGGMALALATTARNEGQTESRMLNESMRFEVRPGEMWGTVLDKQPGGAWLARPERYAGFSDGASGFTVLSDADIARLRAPMTTPIPPPQPSSPPPLPIVTAPVNTTPGSQPAPPLPGTPGYVGAPPLTAEELLIERRNGEALGASLENAGQARPSGYEAHHIVPSRAGDMRMEALRQRLIGLGLDLNEAANGVWLPGANAPANASGAYHPKLNNRAYNEAVVAAFRDVTTLQEAQDTLARISSQLKQGGDSFPGIRPRG